MDWFLYDNGLRNERVKYTKEDLNYFRFFAVLFQVMSLKIYCANFGRSKGRIYGLVFLRTTFLQNTFGLLLNKKFYHLATLSV